jgi:hypothetical protein
MADAMVEGLGRLHGHLDLREVVDGQGRTVMKEGRVVWELLQHLAFFLYWARSDDAIIVPAGFLTDLASIPRLARGLVPVSGSFNRAAIIHDWLYKNKGAGIPENYRAGLDLRAKSDHIFNEAMRAAGVSTPMRLAMFSAVRLGGWAGWGS